MQSTFQTFTLSHFSSTAWDVHYPHQFKIFLYRFKTPQQASHVASHIVTLCDLHRPFIELGLNEIFLNAIEHGNLEMSGSEKERSRDLSEWQNKVEHKLTLSHNLKKDVRVLVEITSHYVAFETRDQGNGFDWQSLSLSPSHMPQKSGRGLLLASRLCFDTVEFIGKGNIVRCLCWKT